MKQKPSVWKLLLLLVAAAAIIFACIRWLIPLCRYLLSDEGRDAVCAFVESWGVFAPLAFIALMALQIVIAVLPGGPLEVIAGMLFGSWLGILYTELGVLLGTGIVFLLVRIFGRRIVSVFVKEEQMERFSVLHDEEKLEFWVFILFLIPGIPKDLLTYFVPLTRMKGLQFLILTSAARFPALAASVLVGDSLSQGRYWLSITICVLAAIAVFIGLRIRNYIVKRHGEAE